MEWHLAFLLRGAWIASRVLCGVMQDHAERSSHAIHVTHARLAADEVGPAGTVTREGRTVRGDGEAELPDLRLHRGPKDGPVHEDQGAMCATSCGRPPNGNARRCPLQTGLMVTERWLDAVACVSPGVLPSARAGVRAGYIHFAPCQAGQNIDP